jgi:thiamine pyrophosphate-dependent acetolactate synthase large subunit-like protein
MFDEHPMNVGVLGSLSGRDAAELAATADFVLAFGTSLRPATTRGGALFARARVVRFDVDPGVVGANEALDLVRGDAAMSAEALVSELEARGTQLTGFATPPTREILHRLRDQQDDDSEGRTPMDPGVLMRRLNDLLPKERALIVDGGHCGGFACMHLSVSFPRAFVFTTDFSAIGLSMGTAIGAAIAVPDRLTLAVMGDGAFAMTLGELETAVRYHLRLLLIVLNDSAYGAELHFLNRVGMAPDTTLFPPFDIARSAAGIGALGMSVGTLGDLEPLPKLIDTMQGPIVLDCQIDRNVRADWIVEMPQYYARSRSPMAERSG